MVICHFGSWVVHLLTCHLGSQGVKPFNGNFGSRLHVAYKLTVCHWMTSHSSDHLPLSFIFGSQLAHFSRRGMQLIIDHVIQVSSELFMTKKKVLFFIILNCWF